MASSDTPTNHAPLGWLLLAGSFISSAALWVLSVEVGSAINSFRLLPDLIAVLAGIAFLSGLFRKSLSAVPGLMLTFVLLFVPGIFPKDSPEEIRKSQLRSCEANATTLDKVVGVWESQNVTIPVGADGAYGDLEIVFTGDGTIHSCSPELEQLVASPGNELRAGSRALASLAKDASVFRCPTREKKTWFKENPIATERHYRWIAGSIAATALDGQTRGVDCTLHDP